MRLVSILFASADEPYLASLSTEQFEAVSRVVSADDPFRDSPMTSGIFRA